MCNCFTSQQYKIINEFTEINVIYMELDALDSIEANFEKEPCTCDSECFNFCLWLLMYIIIENLEWCMSEMHGEI